jgi:hypothetical protein
MKLVMLLTFIIFVGYGNLMAQTNPVESWVLTEPPVSCHSTWTMMEFAGNNLKSQSNPKGVLIIIARLGDGENWTELNRRRLFNAKETIVPGFVGVESRRIITAVGERVKGFGRVEFYVGGQMVVEILVKRNKDLPADCYDDAIGKYYPLRDKTKSKKRKSKN